MGEYLSIPCLAYYGHMDNVFCWFYYSRQSTFVFEKSLAMDNTLNLTSRKWYLPKHFLLTPQNTTI